MNHLTLRGTHREMGFQWGARLAERGLRLLDHVPFPLEAERRAFAAACHRRMRAISPPPWRSWRGWRRGRTAGRRTWRRSSSPPTPCRPPCGCSCLAVSNGNGVFFGRNSDFLTALEPDYTHVTYGFSDRAIPFTGNTTSFVQMEDAVNARGLAIGLTSVYTPRPRPGLNAGMVLRLLAETCAGRAGGPGPPAGAAPGLLPDADAGGCRRGHCRGGVQPGGDAGGASRPGGTLRLRRESLSLGSGGPAAAGAGLLAGGGAVRHDAPGAGAGGGDAGSFRRPGPTGGAKGLSMPV